MVPDLESAWSAEDHDDFFRDRVEDILHTIHISGITSRLKEWAEAGGDDLLEGAPTSRYRYPELDEQKVRGRLAAIRQTSGWN